MKYFSVDIYFRCVEDGCVGFIIEDFYDSEENFKAIGISGYFFDEDSSDILWSSTQSYDEALKDYLLQITDSKRAKFEEGLEGQWPISDTLYLKYIGEGTLEKEIFISFFEESFFQPVPVLFPDMDTFKEKTEEDFNEHYKKYE